jgi:hypothetical protein
MLVERIGWGSTTWRPPRLHKARFHIVARESTGGEAVAEAAAATGSPVTTTW